MKRKMQRNRYRQIICAMIAFFFVIGIFGTIKNIDTVSFKPYLHSMQQEDTTQAEDAKDDWLLPVCSLQKMDDFQADAVVRRVSPKVVETLCTETLVSVISVLILFLFVALLECLFYFSEKRISYFQVVAFIHQIDGKKKSCFGNKKHCKTGGLRELKLEQSLEFYQSMRKKRYSII